MKENRGLPCPSGLNHLSLQKIKDPQGLLLLLPNPEPVQSEINEKVLFHMNPK
jgi:hypothetical protein